MNTKKTVVYEKFEITQHKEYLHDMISFKKILRVCSGESWIVCCFFIILTMVSCVSCSRVNEFSNSSDNGSELLISNTIIDLGEIREDEPVETKFSLKNAGADQLIIHKVRFSCGCTTSRFSTPKTLDPGEVCELPVKFNPKGFAGEIIRKLTLVTNDKEMPKKVLKLKARVRQNYKNISYAPTKVNLGFFDGDLWKKTILFRLPEGISPPDLECKTSLSSIKSGFVGIKDGDIPKYDFDLSRIPNKDQYRLLCVYSDNKVTDRVVSEWVEVRSKSNFFEPIKILIQGVNASSSCSTRIR